MKPRRHICLIKMKLLKDGDGHYSKCLCNLDAKLPKSPVKLCYTSSK